MNYKLGIKHMRYANSKPLDKSSKEIASEMKYTDFPVGKLKKRANYIQRENFSTIIKRHK